LVLLEALALLLFKSERFAAPLLLPSLGTFSSLHDNFLFISIPVVLLKSLGVDHVVDLSHENVTQSIKDFLKARNLKGVDVLYDPVGGKLTKEVLRLLNWGAHILVIGFASGEVPVIPANIALVKVRLYMIGGSKT